jgi:hypothetical protein
MYRQLIFMAAWMALAAVRPQAQEALNLPGVDAQTFALWAAQDWEGLIKSGKEALAQDIDFYYLRARLGIAYYETRNYRQAIAHLEKAYRIYSGEAFLQEYLYYAYLFAGRSADARFIAAAFPAALKQKTGAGENRAIARFDVFYNANFIGNQAVIDQYAPDFGLEIEGAQFIPRQHQYAFLGLQHELSPRFSLYHGYSGMRKIHYLYWQDGGAAGTKPAYQSWLNQYYAAAHLRLARGLNLAAGFHYFNIRYPLELEVIRQGRPFVTTATVTDNDYVFFASLHKDLSYATIGGSFYYGTLNDGRQYQKDLKLALYPLGNNRLYVLSNLAHQSDQAPGELAQQRWVFEQQAGIQLARPLWLEGYATFGELHNFLLNDGLVVFNGLDVVKQRYGARLLVFPNPKWSIRLDYTYFRQESAFVAEGAEGGSYHQLHYTNHSITGGLTWGF